MKHLIPILLCIAAAGCARTLDLNSDTFATGNASQEKFGIDNQHCAQQAELKRSYDLQGVDAENVEKHRIYNRAFVACMRAKGYEERGGMLDFWVPYDL